MDAEHVSAATAANDYLTSLPAELRNRIYDLVFTPNVGEWRHVLNAEEKLALPPSHSLVLTNRQVYEETIGLHRDATRQFWAQTTFDILVTDNEAAGAAKDAIAAMRDQDVAALQHVRVVSRKSKNPNKLQAYYELKDSVWRHQGQGGDELERWMMVPPGGTVPTTNLDDQDSFQRHGRRYVLFGLADFGHDEVEAAKQEMNKVSLTKHELRGHVELMITHYGGAGEWNESEDSGLDTDEEETDETNESESDGQHGDEDEDEDEGK